MFIAKQKGLSPIGILFVVSVFAFTIMIVLKLGNHYMEYNSIRGIFKATAELPELKDMNDERIKIHISKQFTINTVTDVNLNQIIYIDRGNKVFGFEYEVRQHLLANIDAVLTFSHEEELP